MVQEIKRWLASDQDYAAGVALYETHGSSNVRKRMFASGATSFNREKLTQSLQELLSAEKPKPKTPSTTPAAKVTTVPTPNPNHQEHYEALMKQRQSLLDERTLAHARLNIVPEGEQLLKLSLQILELVPQIKKLNYIRKSYLVHGCLPDELFPKPKVDESDKASLIQHRNNLRTKRSRLRKHPESNEQELATIETEIQRLTILINSK